MKRLALLTSVVAVATTPALVRAQPKDGAEQSQAQASRRFKGRLGLMVMDMTSELRMFFGAATGRGVLVARVEEGSPAQAAGLEVGDVVERVADRDVQTAWDVIAALAERRKGERVEIELVRARASRRLDVLLADDPVERGADLQEHQSRSRFAPDGMQRFKEIWQQRMDEAGRKEVNDTHRRLEELEQRMERLERKEGKQGK